MCAIPAVLWAGLFSVITGLTVSESRGNCSWSHKAVHSGYSSAAVTCVVTSLTPEERIVTPSTVESFLKAIYSLYVICASDSQQFSSLGSYSFSGVEHLEQLDISMCHFSHFPSLSFHELHQLRSLSIAGNPTRELSSFVNITQNNLSHLTKVSRLNLNHLSILHIDNDALCTNKALHSLNVSHNLMDNCNTGLTQCANQLRHLDISHNRLHHINASCFSALTNLRSLYLKSNRIQSIDSKWLKDKNRLITVSLTGNFITRLSGEMFSGADQLSHLDISSNNISHIPTHLIAPLEQLSFLNLSNNRIEDVRRIRIVGGIRLIVLDLSHNRITRLPYVDDLFSLQLLNLSHNRITHLTGALMTPLINLATLDLSYNGVKHVSALSLPGLSSLYLGYNQLTALEVDDVVNCQLLQDLLLDHNRLSSVPSAAIARLQQLQKLDISTNHLSEALLTITSIVAITRLENLIDLALAHNTIRHLRANSLSPALNVQRLDLRDNLISSIEPDTFRQLTALQRLYISGNRLAHIGQLFMGVASLRVLDLSANKIVHFDLAMLPRELLQLNIADNNISTVGNHFSVEATMSLQSLNIASNSVAEVNSKFIPDKLQKLILHKNVISKVDADAFTNKHLLNFVDLSENYIETVSEFPLKNRTVDLSLNPLKCDCTMDWLMDSYVRIVSKNLLHCQPQFSHSGSPTIPVASLRRSDFLCSYHTHCFALCHCCDFDACDCEMACPYQCTCYHDVLWNVNIVDCSHRNFTELPSMIPMDVKVMHLHGNRISSLGSHQLIGRKHLQSLYLNNSHIQSVDNKTFNGLAGLLTLHLEYNYIEALVGYEFDDLEKLEQLYLQHNRIRSIDRMVFEPLRNLQRLTLHGNRLISLPQWPFNGNRRLSQLTLADNPWKCECRFAEALSKWISASGVTVSDQNEINCTSHGREQKLVLNVGRNCSVDSKVAETSIMQRSLFSFNIVMSVLVLAAFLVTLSLLLFIWRYRHTEKRLKAVWQKSANRNQKYDVFIGCSSHDAPLAAGLSKELETGVPSYRCCLPGRDIPAQSDPDSLQQAVNTSRQCVLIVTPNWFKDEWSSSDIRFVYTNSKLHKPHGLILVWCEPINSQDVDSEMQKLIERYSFVRFYDTSEWSSLRKYLSKRKHLRNPFRTKKEPSSYLESSPLVFENYKLQHQIKSTEDMLLNASNTSTLPCANALLVESSQEPHHIYYTIDVKSNGLAGRTNKGSSSTNNHFYNGTTSARLHRHHHHQSYANNSACHYNRVVNDRDEFPNSMRTDFETRHLAYLSDNEPQTGANVAEAVGTVVEYTTSPWLSSPTERYRSRTANRQGTYFV